MGIVVRHEGRILFYLKGAEVAMYPLIKPAQRDTIIDQCEDLAREGLRTLVISQRIIEQEWYDDWKIRFNEANSKLDDRKEHISKSVSELEKNMELLGVTGVEGKFGF